MDFEMPNRMVCKFENAQTGEEVLVDVTDQFVNHMKFDLVLQLLRDLGIESAYKAVMASGCRFADGPDYDEGTVIVPDEFRGMRFGEYRTRFDTRGMDEVERARVIDDAVAEFARGLEAVEIEAELAEQVDAAIDARTCFELSDAVDEAMSELVSKAVAYRVTHGMAHFPPTDEDTDAVLDEYGNHLMGVMGSIALSAINSCDDDLRHAVSLFDGCLREVSGRLPDDVSGMGSCPEGWFLPPVFYVGADLPDEGCSVAGS